MFAANKHKHFINPKSFCVIIIMYKKRLKERNLYNLSVVGVAALKHPLNLQ